MDALSIISKSLPPAPVGLAYSEQLQAIGGTPSYTWTLVSGSLPSGMALSTSGLLTAAAGAIPASATGTHTFRLRARDFVATDVFYDYTLEVPPAAYGRVPEFLLDARFRDLVGKYLLTDSNRLKNERHFFRALLGVLGDTYAHLDRDILAEDWKTAGNNVSVRTALDEIYTATLLAIKTISGIGPTGAGDFDMVAGTGLTATPQPNGLRLDVDAAAIGGLSEYNLEADVAPWSAVNMATPSLPDVAETWIRDDMTSTWHRASEQSHWITKHISGPPPNPGQKLWSCCCGNDKAMSTPFFFKVAYDVSVPAYIISKYDAYTMVLLNQLSVPCPGFPYGEPLLMQCPTFPYTLIFCACVSPNPVPPQPPPASPASLLYAEIDPDGSMAIIQAWIGMGPAIDPSSLGLHPNDDEAFDNAHWRLYGTFVADGVSTNGVSAVIALKLQYAFAISQSEPVLISFPVVGAAPPPPCTPSFGTRTGFVNADSLDVVLYAGAVPNPLLWLVSDFRWTNAMACNLWLFKLPPIAAWTALPAVIAPMAPMFVVSVDSSNTDGMEFAKGKIAQDTIKDTANVVYVKDVFGGPVVIPVKQGPPLHKPSLNYSVIQGVGGGGPAVFLSGVLDDEDVNIDTLAEGEFGRWWIDGTKAYVYYMDPKWSQDREYIRRSIFDGSGPIGNVEDIFNFPIQWATPAIGCIRPAVVEYGLYDPSPRAGAYLSSTAGPTPYTSVLSVDSAIRPNSFRTYYDGTDVLFENNTSFTWHVKMEALTNETTVNPVNLMVAAWQLAQGLQNYWNAINYYPSASSNPPGPGGVQGTVWTENELATTTTPLGGPVFFPTYYSVTPGTWDLEGGAVAQAKYYSIGAPGASTDQWLVFRYNTMPAAITAAEAAMAAVIGAAIPAPGVYTLAQIDTAMGMGGAWVAAYSGSPFDRYQYFCFVNANSTGYYHGWFSENYIHNAQVYGPAPVGGITGVPFIEHFTMAADAVPGTPTEFTIARYCRYAEVMVNGIEYYQGADWAYGITTNKISYLNVALPNGYPLHAGDVVSIKYLV